MVSNIMILKAGVEKYIVEDLPHIKNLLSLLDEERFPRERFRLSLLEEGFVWFISIQNVLKFKYHAVVRTPHPVHFNYQNLPLYTGDIPDFAINRAALALKCGLELITIHSMRPMPIERVKTDPVLIGWESDPNFEYPKRGAEGVVIAIWDNDKELEL